MVNGTRLGPVLCNMFLTEAGDGAEWHPQQFADETKPGGAAGSPEGHAAVQRNLTRLEKRAGEDLM